MSREQLHRLYRSRSGNVLMLTAAMMPMLMGAAALSLDAIQWALARRQLQRMADSAALAGGFSLLREETPAPAVTRDLQINNKVPLTSSPIIQNAPVGGPYSGDMRAVRVVLRTTPDLPFVKFFMSSSTTISAEATAKAEKDQKYCMIGLETSGTPVEVTGNGTIDFACGFFSNSASTSALTVSGSSTVVRVPALAAVGRVASSVTLPSTTSVLNNQASLDDPLRNLPPAQSFHTTCSNGVSVANGTNVTLVPGCYRGMSITGSAVLTPGTYVINEADFEVTGTLVGEGVTIVLTGNSPRSIGRMLITGQAVVNLAAPTSGPLANVLFYQDRRSIARESIIAGGGFATLKGTMYFPNTRLEIAGNSSQTFDCFRAISKTLRLAGNMNAANSCSDTRYNLYGETVKLVA